MASISFGSPAKMKFRVKAKYMATYKLSESKSPAKKRVKIEPADLGVGAVIDEEALLDPALDLGDAKEDDDDGDNNRTNQKDHRVKLELRLNHGDVVVMRGREIQRIWEVGLHCNKFRLQSFFLICD